MCRDCDCFCQSTCVLTLWIAWLILVVLVRETLTASLLLCRLVLACVARQRVCHSLPVRVLASCCAVHRSAWQVTTLTAVGVQCSDEAVVLSPKPLWIALLCWFVLACVAACGVNCSLTQPSRAVGHAGSHRWSGVGQCTRLEANLAFCQMTPPQMG